MPNEEIKGGNESEEVLFDCKTYISYELCIHQSLLAEYCRNGSFHHCLLLSLAVCISEARYDCRIYDGTDDNICDSVENSFFSVFRWNQYGIRGMDL